MLAGEKIVVPTVDPERLAVAHGWLNVANGLWPILSMRSFEAVFGPKVDRWLVYTVAGLMITSGYNQVQASRGATSVARTIGIGAASTLLALDAIYVPKGRIRWTYLLDGVAEAGWLLLWRRTASRS